MSHTQGRFVVAMIAVWAVAGLVAGVVWSGAGPGDGRPTPTAPVPTCTPTPALVYVPVVFCVQVRPTMGPPTATPTVRPTVDWGE
jgi:hypothetical protein